MDGREEESDEQRTTGERREGELRKAASVKAWTLMSRLMGAPVR